MDAPEQEVYEPRAGAAVNDDAAGAEISEANPHTVIGRLMRIGLTSATSPEDPAHRSPVWLRLQSPTPGPSADVWLPSSAKRVVPPRHARLSKYLAQPPPVAGMEQIGIQGFP